MSADSSTSAPTFAGLDALAVKGDAIAYVGYDCTAPSLHIGHLYHHHDAALAAADRRNKPIALMGGGTTRVGDPSGKDETRTHPARRADRGQQGRHQGRVRQVPRLRQPPARRHHGSTTPSGWRKLNYIEFLRDVGRHFSVNRMLTMDSAKLRLERDQELSLHRVQLHAAAGLRLRRAGPALRLQPADGRLRPVGQHRHRHRPRPAHGHAPALRADLPAADHRVRRQDGQDGGGRGVAQRGPALAPTTTGSSGATPRTATWAASSSCSRALPLAEIAKLAALQGAEINEAKKVLATEATALLHGREKAEAAARTAQETFEKGATSEGLPTVEIAASELAAGLGVLAAFVKAGLVKSNGEARRQIQGGGLRVNDAARERRERQAHTQRRERRRDQALARQEAACAAAGGITPPTSSEHWRAWAPAYAGMTPVGGARQLNARHSRGGGLAHQAVLGRKRHVLLRVASGARAKRIAPLLGIRCIGAIRLSPIAPY